MGERAPAERVIKHHQDLTLSNEAFDRLVTELDAPAQPVLELAELFRANPPATRRPVKV